MLATSDPDRIDIAFDDDRLVADAGLLLPAHARPASRFARARRQLRRPR